MAPAQRKTSAGLLMYRRAPRGVEVLLVHPGGPFWARKDDGAWSIPKGEMEAGEDAEAAARREFLEETGLELHGEALPLGSVRQAGGKTVHGFAIEGDVDAAAICSNTFEMEWPPRSGKIATFPEVDRAAWFPLDIAGRKINPAQIGLLEELSRIFSSQ